MSTQRETGRFTRIAAIGAVTALLLSAAAVSGCDSMAKPGGPSGNGMTPAEQAARVPSAVTTEAITVLGHAGITVKNPAYVIMAYTSDAKDGIEITGVMHKAGSDNDLAEVILAKSGSTWKIASAK